MWRIVVIIGCLSVGSPALAQNRATIEKLNDAWTAAFNKGDAAAVAAALYSEDAYVLPPGSAMVKGRPEIEAFVVPGGNFPTMSSIAGWEQEFDKPVVTTNQASFWAMLRAFDSADMTGKTVFEHALYKALQGEIDVRNCEEFDGFERFEILTAERP